MTNTADNNKRIAKNTLMLYFRMMLTMGVSLFTVRVVLDTLGIIDYGIYNVVGGVVTMFSFLSTTLASASQRFFAFELGRRNYDQLKKTFSMTMTIYLMIGLVILVLAETLGLWFLNNQMNIPPHRIASANWVYQFSILSFMMTMFTIPYDALIIAHEKMNVYAWVSIIEVLLKLLIVYLLVLFSSDKLKLYSSLIFGVTTIITFTYRTYCKRNFDECSYSFYWDVKLFKEIMSYSGWNLFGGLAAVFKNQGLNILLNIFFGPIINTAYGIANQVYSAVNQFVNSFMTATKPQIIKYYANNDTRSMLYLVYKSTEISYFLLFIISTPLLLETKFLLSIWLKEVPEYAILFTRLIVIIALIDTLSLSVMTSVQATGNVKKYQLIVGGVQLLILPLSYLSLKLGYSADIVFYISIIIAFISLFIRLFLLSKLIDLSINSFIVKVIAPCLTISAFTSILIYIINLTLTEGFSRTVSTFVFGFSITSLSIYLFSLSTDEKNKVLSYIKSKIHSKLIKVEE